MNDAENRTHFSLWAMMAAPLIAGNDLTRMSDATRAILLNQELIAIDQDPLGAAALIVRDDGGPQVWSRPLADPNARAVALFNPTDAPATITARWSEIGLPPGAASVRDLWAAADRGSFVDQFTAQVEPHGTVMLKIVAPMPAPPEPTPEPPTPPADIPAAGGDGRAPDAPAAISYPYLSDLAPTFASSFFGPAERDMSNGEDAAGDGRPITIGGTSYAKGLGVHAPSELRYDLGGRCSAFAADVGLDAEVGAQPLPVYLDITGAHELRLVVVPAGDSSDYAHADWAGARVACGS